MTIWYEGYLEHRYGNWADNQLRFIMNGQWVKESVVRICVRLDICESCILISTQSKDQGKRSLDFVRIKYGWRGW